MGPCLMLMGQQSSSEVVIVIMGLCLRGLVVIQRGSHSHHGPVPKAHASGSESVVVQRGSHQSLSCDGLYVMVAWYPTGVVCALYP